MGKKKDIIRIDDEVKVVIPEVFVRCGYPLCLNDMIKKVQEEEGEKILKFLSTVGIDGKIELDLFNKSYQIMVEEGGMRLPAYDDSFHKIVKAIAYKRIEQLDYGGKERKIYTERNEEIKDLTFTVVGISYKQTGIYTTGSTSSIDGEVSPPYLANMKVHKILLLYNFMFWASEDIRIEAKNVIKI